MSSQGVMCGSDHRHECVRSASRGLTPAHIRTVLVEDAKVSVEKWTLLGYSSVAQISATPPEDSRGVCNVFDP
jgi:hypothetical protein